MPERIGHYLSGLDDNHTAITFDCSGNYVDSILSICQDKNDTADTQGPFFRDQYHEAITGAQSR